MHHNILTPEHSTKLLKILEVRFEKNIIRHKDLNWGEIKTKLKHNADKLWSLNEMEETNGEPDVVGFDKKNDEYIFFDCSAESPKRRSLCYDYKAWESRKANKPENNVIQYFVTFSYCNSTKTVELL